MSRNRITQAIFLKSLRFGETHKSVTLVSPDFGVINAIAHGAYKPKSKLGGVTEVFSYSKVYLYHEPVKNSFKITDVEPVEIYEKIRASLTKYYTASLWAETVIRTYGGGGDFYITFELLKESVHLLDRCAEDRTDLVLSLFLFRYIESLGYLPDFSVCSACGSRPGADASWFIGPEGTVRCRNCAHGDLPAITAGARKYLAYADGRSLEALLNLDLDTTSRSGLKRAMISLVQHVIGGQLNTIKASGGII